MMRILPSCSSHRGPGVKRMLRAGTLHIFKQPLLLWISLNVIRARHPVARWCVVSQNGEVSMKWLGSLGAEFGNRRPSGQNLGLGSGLL
eukprot:1141539-Pelagomonas_calceolata.AAC.6